MRVAIHPAPNYCCLNASKWNENRYGGWRLSPSTIGQTAVIFWGHTTTGDHKWYQVPGRTYGIHKPIYIYQATIYTNNTINRAWYWLWSPGILRIRGVCPQFQRTLCHRVTVIVALTLCGHVERRSSTKGVINSKCVRPLRSNPSWAGVGLINIPGIQFLAFTPVPSH